MSDPFSFAPTGGRLNIGLLPASPNIEDRRDRALRGNRPLREAAAMTESDWSGGGDVRLLLHPLHLAFPGRSDFSHDIDQAVKSAEMATVLSQMRREADARARLAAWNDTHNPHVVRSSPLLEQLHGDAPELMFGSLASEVR